MHILYLEFVGYKQAAGGGSVSSKSHDGVGIQAAAKLVPSGRALFHFLV